ncbi:MAG: YceD family protein [Desulfuromonadaceae bacterium]
MKIVVDHIKDVPVLMHFDEPVETFPLLAAMQNDSSCSITGNIQGDMTVTREYENIRVSGRITAPLALACSRCLADYASFVDTNFTIFFRKGEISTPADEEELELGEMDLLSSTYSGDEIDLTHEIEEQVAMEIPLKPLCSDSCKGLCHECGVDLNTSSCSCSKEPVTLTFSALKDFKVTRK